MRAVDFTVIPHLHPAPPVEPPVSEDPDFLRASAWLARGAGEPRAIVLGAPFAGGSISRARCDLLPAALRKALQRFSVWSSDHAVSLERLAARDAGDIERASSVEETQARIASVIEALPKVPLVLVGGDNSITVGGARGVHADALLTFDAHHDCRDPARGATNGSPVRQLVEGGLTAVVQIGIHGFANAEPHARWALDHKIHVILATRVHDFGIRQAIEGALKLLEGAQRIWVDFDLDVLDRARAPGAPASLPGGLSPGMLQQAAFLLGKESRVAGIDITEVDPSADVAETTVRAACMVMLSYLAGVASRS